MSDLQDEIARTLDAHAEPVYENDCDDERFECQSCDFVVRVFDAETGDVLGEDEVGHQFHLHIAATLLPLFEREARRREAAAWQHTCGAFWTIEPDYETPDTPCEMCGTEDAWTPLYREVTP